MISVVIPYFQRAPGILRRALASVMRQRGIEKIEVVVVDDASPVSPTEEIASLGVTPRFPVRVMRRRNGGPGAARNTGLDNLDAAIRYVAFLDSDDEWTDDHLANAVRALGSGFDFYFADLYQLNQSVSGFERAGRIHKGDHPPIAEGEDSLRKYEGDMFVQIVTGNVIGTSTVAYDFRKFADVRFRTEFLNAGEDYLFWMELARRGARFAFSTKPEATYGPGVNIYSGAGWGTPQHFLRIHNEMKYRKATLREFPLSDEMRRFVRGKIGELRSAAVGDLLHRLRHGGSPGAALLLEHLRLDPMTYLAGLPFALRKLVGPKSR